MIRPVRYARPEPVAVGPAARGAQRRLCQRACNPRKPRYAAPRTLTTKYASAEAARIAASPTTVNAPHTSSPVVIPAAVRRASALPEAIARLVTTAMSGPGTTVNRASTPAAMAVCVHI